ncbi:MAG TPA: lysophospholipid acyltransferase family protein [Steroidobacteraceae bacterium]|jgi:KDO2-lipid IV(A) lauroyltransferase|nr:lysophospholipid acyltransferase family protein [Steroidobacteraceae bacterium]
MLKRVTADDTGNSTTTPEAVRERSAWWARLVALVPLDLLYGFAGFIGWLMGRFFPHRVHVVRENLTRAFPDYDEPALRRVIRAYYLGFAQVLVEVVKAVRMKPDELQRRVRITNLAPVRELLDEGQSVLLVAAHQCNWEWLLLGLAVQLGYPLDAAYKPLVNSWAEREMKKLRTRFGSRLVPATDLLPDIIKRRGITRVIAMVADQEPTTSEHKYWTRFLNRDSAFYMGPEEIARATRFPVFFLGLKRVRRGFYEVSLTALTTAGEQPASGTVTERYARLVEAQIHDSPPDWPWSHKRWKLKRSLYSGRARAPGSG